MAARGPTVIVGMKAASSAPFSGTLNVDGASAAFTPELGRPVYVNLSGTWTGTVTIERSFDGGATWLPMTAGGQSWGTFTANASEQVDVPTSAAITLRVSFDRASGTLEYALIQ